MKHCCKNCPNCDPWERKLPGGYNDEYWGEPGKPISEEEQKKLLEFAEAFGNAVAKTASNFFKKATENKNRESKYGHDKSQNG